MKDIRLGESLWLEWIGEGDLYFDTGLVYFTLDHVDIENETVRRALASAIQRDGIGDSLSDGFQMISESETVLGWGGVLPDEKSYIVTDPAGESRGGDVVDPVQKITWVIF